jgi:PAS domain S-box-containing protein
MPQASLHENRILVLAPTSKDAALARNVFDKHGIDSHVCANAAELFDEAARGAGAILVAEEALDHETTARLSQFVGRQPPWSDLPILLLTRHGAESAAVLRAVETLGNVTLVERPARVAALVTSARTALRARERQYQARAHLLEREQAAEALRSSEQRFRTLVEQVKDYAIFMTDISGRATSWNEGVQRVFGFTEEEFVGIDILSQIFTPEDVENGVPQKELAEASATGTGHNDRWMRRKDGTHFWASGITTALYDSAKRQIGFTKVVRDLTAEKQTEQALREADRRKDEFLATLAHELRNPLAPIRNSLHILRLSSGNDATFERVCEMMERQVNHMVRLVDDLMEVSRITRGSIDLRKEPVELAAIIRNAVETSKPLIEAAKLQLAISLPPDSVVIDGDAVRLAQVVANLLNNAAKYTNEGGQIWLTGRSEIDEAVISVRDNGIGIPAAMQLHVFDMFTQVDQERTRSQGGLGIGLTLVRSLVELHGGSVGVHSEGQGMGTEFTVRLPLAAPQPAAGGRTAAAPTTKLLPPQRVLVVDDNRDAANSLGMLIKYLGAEVHVAHDGPTALKAVDSFKPSVVLLDIGMPEMDGFEVAQRIRRRGDDAGILLIALTGWGQDEDRRRTEEAGFDHHLVKPADITSLQALLASRGKGPGR